MKACLSAMNSLISCCLGTIFTSCSLLNDSLAGYTIFGWLFFPSYTTFNFSFHLFLIFLFLMRSQILILLGVLWTKLVFCFTLDGVTVFFFVLFFQLLLMIYLWEDGFILILPFLFLPFFLELSGCVDEYFSTNLVIFWPFFFKYFLWKFFLAPLLLDSNCIYVSIPDDVPQISEPDHLKSFFPFQYVYQIMKFLLIHWQCHWAWVSSIPLNLVSLIQLLQKRFIACKFKNTNTSHIVIYLVWFSECQIIYFVNFVVLKFL